MSPSRAKRPCSHPGCPTLTNSGKCDEHRKAQQKRADTKTPEERAFYSSGRWQKIRDAQIKREPLCRTCREEDGRVTLATTADHIVPRRQGGSDDPSNLQSMQHASSTEATGGTRTDGCGKVRSSLSGERRGRYPPNPIESLSNRRL